MSKVPHEALTVGVGTVMDAREVMFLLKYIKIKFNEVYISLFYFMFKKF